jgi:O-antigen/teichoic acid export membrane protein
LGILREVFSTALVAGNGEKLFAKIFGGTAFLNAGLMLYCVRWGPVGTAAALVITQGVLLVVCVFAVRRVVTHPVQWNTQARYAMKILLNSAMMGGAVWVIRPYVPVEVAILVGMMIYAGLTLATKAVPWREVLATVRMVP